MDNETIIIAFAVIAAVIVAVLALCLAWAVLLILIGGIGRAWRGE